MKWKKLGRIFNPTEHKLANNCFEYAQSPQALVFENFIRIYFSSRETDRKGKYLSHVSFIDIDKNFKTIINISKDTVIKLGGLGCFDEHGIFPFNVLRVKDKVFGYTTGWNRKVSVSTDGSIGLAISEDNGVTFSKLGMGPILTASLHEPFLVGDPFVKIMNGVFHMWYICGVRWTNPEIGIEPDRVYKIMHATSNDGVKWVKEGRYLIADKLNSDECQALPTVIKLNETYHMFFCYRYATDFRKNKMRGYRIGYSFSNDLIDWSRDDDQVGIDLSLAGWDSEMMCYPNVFECDGKIYLLYNGNEFGKLGFGLAVLESI